MRNELERVKSVEAIPYSESFAMLDFQYTSNANHWREFASSVQRRITGQPEVGSQQFTKLLGVAVILASILLLISIAADRQCAAAGVACWIDPLSLALGAILAFFTVVAFGVNLRKKSIDAAVEENGVLLGKREIKLSDDGIEVIGSKNRANYKWDAIKELGKGQSILTLWMERGAGIYVPRSAFADANAEKKFVDYVKQHVPGLKSKQARGVHSDDATDEQQLKPTVKMILTGRHGAGRSTTGESASSEVQSQ